MRRIPLLILPLLLVAGPAHGQDGFLFRPPMGELTLRAGPIVPRAQSDVFDFLTSELTIQRGDFRAPAVAAEVAFFLTDRLDLALGAGWSESNTRSEFREFIGDDGLPIEQTTSLRLVPLTASVRFLPLERGRRLSGLAWLPRQTLPYVGGGLGMTWYRLQQDGEFIEPETLEIFIQEYESSDHALTAHALAGLHHWFTPRIGANLEGRYTWGSAGLAGSFRSYDKLDLTGFQFGLGVSFRW
jgi:hypothetical protein